jgi:hypothetical protein
VQSLRSGVDRAAIAGKGIGVTLTMPISERPRSRHRRTAVKILIHKKSRNLARLGGLRLQR